MSKKRICVIGAGPSGMSFLYHLARMKDANVPDVVCYERQEDWSGMWNVTWRTGVDQYGEMCHNAQYHHLWSNSPKECLEFPDYTFEAHFGKAIPSFPPQKVMRHYQVGRWTRDNMDLRRHIRFSTMVKDVVYNKDTDDFTVKAKDLAKDSYLEPEKFSHVIVAVGMFNVPNVPYFPGLNTFPGRVLHSHDFRDAREFQGKRLLAIGSHYSAEDVALQCRKFGSGPVICSWRTKPMGFNWPEGIEERPLLQRVDGNTVYFKDGTSAEVDTIFLCTGYVYHYPFLPDELRLKSKTSMYPPNLYKGTVWTNGGNRKLLYVGAQDQYYSFTMFDVQALWACKYIMGELPAKDVSDGEMEADIEKWRKKLAATKDCHDDIDFQTDFMRELSLDVGYPLAVLKSRELFHEWEDHKVENIVTFRDRSFTCLFTGTPSPKHHTPWLQAFDDSIEGYLNPEQKDIKK